MVLPVLILVQGVRLLKAQVQTDSLQKNQA